MFYQVTERRKLINPLVSFASLREETLTDVNYREEGKGRPAKTCPDKEEERRRKRPRAGDVFMFIAGCLVLGIRLALGPQPKNRQIE